MNKTPKVSIIIPFYNVEKYIEECIKSVVNQTLKDIEIIFVNDGSDDGSLNIVNKYAKKDARIRILSLNERHGQGFARNRAIDVATGEYIGFVDSDDYVMTDMFEKLYAAALQSNTDITMCLAKEYDDTTGEFIESDYYSLKLFEEFKDSVFPSEAIKDKILDMNVALWNKLYKRTYLPEINEKFPEGYIFEDLPFFFGTYLPAKRVKIIWDCLYIYRINRKTSTMNQFGNKMLDRIPMVVLTYEKIKKYPLFNEIEKDIQAWIINDIFHRYTLLSVGYQKEYFFAMKKLFGNLEIKNPDDEYWQRVFHFRGYLLVMNNSFEEFNQKVFYKYIEVNEIEDRFNSKILNIRTALATHGANIVEADRRLTKVYDDIQESYKYSEELVGNLDDKLQKCVDNIYKDSAKIYDFDIPKIYEYIENRKEDIFCESNAKMNAIYEEITKNYKYTEKIVSEAENRCGIDLSDRISKVYEEFPKLYEYADSAKEEAYVRSTERINAIYDEIEKNYKYTEKIVGDSEVKTESTFDEKISKVYEEITKVYDYVNQYKKYVYENSEASPEQIKVSISGAISEYFAEKHIDEIVKNIYDELYKLKEYADKCKVESIMESSEKLTPVYEDIDKNYKYTEELVSNSKKECEISTDKKISQIYEDFHKVYDYVNSCKEENSLLTKDCTDKLYADLNKFSEDLKEIVTEAVREAKIEAYNNLEKMREEINEERSKTREKTAVEFTNIFETIAKNNSEILKRVDNVEKNTAEKQIQNENSVSELRKELKSGIDKLIISQSELKKNIDNNELKIENSLNKIEILKNDFSQDIKNISSKTEAEFENIDKRFENTEKRFENIDKHFENTEKSVTAVSNEIKNNTKTFFNLYDELKTLQTENAVKTEEKINSLDENINLKIKNLEEKSDVLNEKIDNSDTKINQVRVKMENTISDAETYLSNKINTAEKQASAKIKELYSYTNNELSNIYKSFNEANNQIQQNIISKTENEDKRFYQNTYMISEINKTVEKKADIEELEKIKGSVSLDIENIKFDFENKLSNIKSEYELKLDEQKSKYEDKLADLENKLNLLEEDRKERQKGLFYKLFARKKNK